MHTIELDVINEEDIVAQCQQHGVWLRRVGDGGPARWPVYVFGSEDRSKLKAFVADIYDEDLDQLLPAGA